MAAFGLIVPATMATAQTVDGSAKAVQPKAVQAADRHQARPSGNTVAVDAAVEQSGTRKTVETPIRAEAVIRDLTRSKAMNRTAQAHLETQSKGLAPLGMICHSCDPEPPCRGGTTGSCSNSPIVDGASIAARR